jgi:hypothetical protein
MRGDGGECRGSIFCAFGGLPLACKYHRFKIKGGINACDYPPTMADGVSIQISSKTKYIISTSGRVSSLIRYRNLLQTQS